MTTLAKFTARDGTPILVEVSPTDIPSKGPKNSKSQKGKGYTTLAIKGDMGMLRGPLPEAGEFDSAMQGLSHIVEAVTKQISGLPARPHEVQVQFGLKIGVGAGVIIAKASGEANLQVTLKWTP